MARRKLESRCLFRCRCLFWCRRLFRGFCLTHSRDLLRGNSVADQGARPGLGELPGAVLEDEGHVLRSSRALVRLGEVHSGEHLSRGVARQDRLDDLEVSAGFILRLRHHIEDFNSVLTALDGAGALLHGQLRVGGAGQDLIEFSSGGHLRSRSLLSAAAYCGAGGFIARRIVTRARREGHCGTESGHDGYKFACFHRFYVTGLSPQVQSARLWQSGNMVHVSVISTGGTIACTRDADGGLTPTLSAAELVERAGLHGVTARDITALDSSAMTFADIDAVVTAVHEELEDHSGVVVTHGTDSLVDTAFALDLFFEDPVVVTGAMRPADHEEPDGFENLRTAVRSLRSRTHVVFCGEVLPARGLIKGHTEALNPFVSTGDVPENPVHLPPVSLAGMNVPIVTCYPGAPASILDGHEDADGLVVEGLGAGNVSAEVGEALADLSMPIVLTTSVPFGKVNFSYGGPGGGNTLGKHGVIPSGWLRAGQARIALAAALRAGVDPVEIIGA